MRCVQVADQARRERPRRIDERVDPGVVHRLLHGIAQPPRILGGLDAPLVLGQRGLGLPVDQPLFDRGMELRGLDDLLEALHRAEGPSRARYSLMSNLKRRQKSVAGGMSSISATRKVSTTWAPCRCRSIRACCMRFITSGSVFCGVNS